MSDLVVIEPDLDSELVSLARRHRKAGGVGLQVLALFGGQTENLLERLPDKVKDQLEEVTTQALRGAMRAAAGSRTLLPDQKPWLNTAVTTAMGAVGGAGGVPTSMAELPITTTVLLRVIQGVAVEHGFDPRDPHVEKACLTVFASAGPLNDDDNVDLGFLAARVTLSGASLQGVILTIAPRLAAILGQKLAAQAVPVLGAAVGAATNYAYTSYYQEMAQIQFGLMRLSEQTGQPTEFLVQRLKAEIAALD